MRIKQTFALSAFMATASFSAVSAEQADPEKQALAYELQQCVGSKVQTATQAFALQEQVNSLRKRAEEAEAKLKASEGAPPAAKDEGKN